jgi:hypothetical protein
VARWSFWYAASMVEASESDIAALERFVAENDELLELEEKIGRFNVFDALGVARAEIKHSNFLAWLLDPNESHGRGDLFLKAVLMDVMRHEREQGKPTPVSPVVLDGSDLRLTTVRREWNKIDVLIECQDPRFILVLENKVDAREGSGQLERYEEVVEAERANIPCIFVFLTPEGEAASRPGWMIYSYEALYRVLRRLQDRLAGTLERDVGVFFGHYLHLIETQIMESETIKDLCRRIYLSHKTAIDLISEHADVGGYGLLRTAGESIQKLPGGPWVFLNRTSRWLRFLPQSWIDASPAIGSMTTDPRVVVYFEIYQDTNQYVRVTVSVGPCANPAERLRLIRRLTTDPGEFGFKLKGKGDPSPQYTRLASLTPCKWKDSDEPAESEVATKVLQAFSSILDKCKNVDNAFKQ